MNTAEVQRKVIVDKCIDCAIWFTPDEGWGHTCKHLAIHNHFLWPKTTLEIVDPNVVPDKCPCLVGRPHAHFVKDRPTK